MFVVEGDVPFPRDDEKGFHGELVSSDRSGNLMICLKTPVLSKLTIDLGNLMNETAQVHTQ